MKKIIAAFILSFLAMIIGSCYFSPLKLYYFAPFLVLVALRTSFNSALWIAALTGLLIDLLNSSHHFGTYSLCYTLSVMLLMTQKKYLNDKAVNMGFYTFAFSFITSLFLIISSYIFDRGVVLSPLSLITIFFLMPLIDMIYALLWIALPLELYTFFLRWCVRFKQGEQWYRFRFFLQKLKRFRLR
ncbi:MAG: hypothetical protein JW769_01835 [Parachlamydiales bacterium]|nr:hypothetical protein [Parachlamydiales bacterium]